MRQHTYKKFILILLLIGFASAFSLTAEEQQRRRGFMIGAHLAWAKPIYNEPFNSTMDDIEALDGVNRLGVGLGLQAGFAVTQNTYVMLGFDGLGDRLYDSIDWIQENTYLFYGGLKFYPMHTGLTIELKGGASSLVELDSYGDSFVSDFGYGLGATLGYDFDKTSRGFTGEVGVAYNYLGGIQIGVTEVTVHQIQIYAKLLIK